MSPPPTGKEGGISERHGSNEVDGTARAAADGDDLREGSDRCHPPPSVVAAAATTAGVGGRWRARDESRRDEDGR